MSTQPKRKEEMKRTEENVTTACISDIKAQNAKNKSINVHKNYKKEKLLPIRTKVNIHHGLTEIKRKYLSDKRPSKSKNIGKKRPITTFSKKSRLKLIYKLNKYNAIYEYWLDLTFPDDVMKGKGVKERARYSSRVFKNLGRYVERKYEGKLLVAWKREWQKRKSGIIVGELCPHYHLLIGRYADVEGQSDWVDVALSFAKKFVDLTGTEEKEKTLKVALNSSSFRPIKDKKQALIYVSKYVSKESELETNNESIGRSWGFIGERKDEDFLSVELTNRESILYQRLIRNYYPKNHKLQKRLKRLGLSSTVFMDELISMRMVECAINNGGEEKE